MVPLFVSGLLTNSGGLSNQNIACVTGVGSMVPTSNGLELRINSPLAGASTQDYKRSAWHMNVTKSQTVIPYL